VQAAHELQSADEARFAGEAQAGVPFEDEARAVHEPKLSDGACSAGEPRARVPSEDGARAVHEPKLSSEERVVPLFA
jgi:hypothetical protein